LSSIRIPPNSTVEIDRIEGDLHVAENSTVKAKDKRFITIAGAIHCEGDCTFDCSVSALSLRGRDGEIIVNGDLLINKSVRVTADGSLRVEGNLSAMEIEVDKELYVGRNLTAEKVDVGGKLGVGGDAKAEDIDVGGKFEADGKVETEKMDVGGSFRGKGTVKAGSVNVGGSFHSEADVSLKIQIGRAHV
jgi:cytoskeletal protein CcmA (bactofilin family)